MYRKTIKKGYPAWGYKEWARLYICWTSKGGVKQWEKQ